MANIDTATLEDLEQTVVLVLTKEQAELLGEITAHAHDSDLCDFGVEENEENEAAFESLLAKLRQL